MKNQGKIPYLFLDALENIEVQSLPVCRVLAVDIADSCGKEIDSQVRNQLALVRICTLTA